MEVLHWSQVLVSMVFGTLQNDTKRKLYYARCCTNRSNNNPLLFYLKQSFVLSSIKKNWSGDGKKGCSDTVSMSNGKIQITCSGT